MNKIIRHMPFYTGIAELHHALGKLMEPNWLESNWIARSMSSDWVPMIDVKEEASRYVVHADIPGVDPKNIEITLENGLLTIKGHRESEKKEESKDYLHLERTKGTFIRSLTLPNAASSDQIHAKSKNGVLEIIVPKTKSSKAHKIQVEEE